MYPFKSSGFRSLLATSKAWQEAALPATLVFSTAHAVGASAWSAYNGECR